MKYSVNLLNYHQQLTAAKKAAKNRRLQSLRQLAKQASMKDTKIKE